MRELEKRNELVRVVTPVSRDLEISEIYFRHARSPDGGKALLFENVEGCDIPVLINALGSDRRIEIGFKRGLDDLAAHMNEFLKIVQMKKPGNLRERLSLLRLGLEMLRFPPKRKRFSRALCQQVVLTGAQIDLNRLPILQCWPKDAGRFVTLPLVVTRSLTTGSRNLGMYRMQVLDKRSTAMHWQIHKDGSHYYNEYRDAKQRMPVSVVIGADPSIIFSALSPMPPNVNELLMAGFIRGSGVETVRCLTNDLEVPANAEIILEGYVDPDDLVDEGPFGDHNGYYTPVGKFPMFHITAITMRRHPVYVATVVGRSPQEDCYLGRATERLFLPPLQIVAPEVRDQHLPWDGSFHNCALFALRKSAPFQGKKLMNHLWGFSQMAFTKSLFVFDEGDDLRSGEALFRKMLERLDLSRDVYITEGVLDQLDHSGLRPLYGGKLGVDLTAKLPEELAGRGEIRGPSSGRRTSKRGESHNEDALKKKILSSFRGSGVKLEQIRYYGLDLKNPVLILGVAKGKKQGAFCEKTARILKLKENPWLTATVVVLVESRGSIENNSLVLWRIFGSVDPIRDMLFIENRHAPDGRILVIDATDKNRHDGYDRDWPGENMMDEGTIRLVDSKWREMFGEEPFDVERP
jgi:4-hydroxy-3-polyprenylbenzoate decarboxylase